jgi:hypothetical protein
MSRKNAYRLLNPYVEGSIDTVVRAKNSFNAGKKLYNTISNFFTNHVEDFYMTVQNVETKELTHFRINEKRTENGTVDYNLVKLEEKFSPELEKKLVSNVEQLEKQTGGKHKHDEDDSSSDSSSSDDFLDDYPLQPIRRFTYFYMPYYKLNMVGLSPLDAARIFVPMFSLPINPSLEIRMDLYKIF